MKNCRRIHLSQRNIIKNGGLEAYTNQTLEVLLEKFEHLGLAYPHSSYLVNLNYVQRYNKISLTLITGENLSIARSKTKKFHQRMNRYWSKKYE
jgi:DNA-binding LytR/AlgR family response regulator